MPDASGAPSSAAAADSAATQYDHRIRAAIGDRYRIERRIGEGGMASVFLAQDLKHHRDVAVKVLHESLAHTIGIRRFLQEIEVIARLQHPHLLTLIDSGDVDGLPYYVMPYLEAQSLREMIVAERRLSIERAVAITREVADGLAYAHAHGVIHRDIKPSNILMSDGHAVVADFGIATALQKAAVGRLTETGISLGSPTYMSPEQAAGERDLDERSDVYSLACVLYEMLAGAPPLDEPRMQTMVTRKLNGELPPLRDRRADVPPELDAAIDKALSAQRDQRFATMEEFANAIVAALPVSKAPASRRLLWTVAAAAVLMLVAGGLWFGHERRVVRATQQVGEINRLASAGRFAAAFELSESVRQIIPSDSTLRRIRPTFTDYIKIVTVPSGARVLRQRLDRPESKWELVGTSPLDSIPMPKYGLDLTYRLRIEREGYEPAEYLPNVFAWQMSNDAIPLDTLRLDRVGASPGMVRIPGFTVADTLAPNRPIRLAAYHIGKYEVTNREYMQFVAAGGYQKREYWKEPFIRDGRELTWEQAMLELRDRTGRPGPSTWSDGTFPSEQEDFPVGGLSWYEAAAYARFAGKQLPTGAHWGQAAMRYSIGANWIYMPTSNLNGTQPRRVGQGFMNAFGLYDIAGNVREWCVNPASGGRLTRGAGWEDADFLFDKLIPKPELDRSPSNGMRLVALTDAESTVAKVAGNIDVRIAYRGTGRDFRKVTAVSDAEFAGYRRIFDYDRTPLESRREATGVVDQVRWEKISFAAAYGGERMIAYLFVPKDAPPPYEPVINWPGSNAMTARSFSPSAVVRGLAGFIPQSGRALVYPLYKGSYERDDSAFSIRISVPESTTYYRDLKVQWIKDLRRTVDYLETRPDMQADRIGYFGNSWGSEVAPNALVLEPRIKAAVLSAAGYWLWGTPRPEVEAANYAPRVRTPTLVLSGRYDPTFPFETSALPFYKQLGTPEPDKKHIVYSTGHGVPQDQMVRESLAWFDRYLTGRKGK
jgi:serine/threonine protein kinase/dienelactone hydrolase